MKPQTLRRRSHGFSLVEMLVVLAIIGIIASVSLPAFKGLSRANSQSAAQRQLLDDLALARQLALKNRTTVYMVFVPGDIWTAAANVDQLNPVSTPEAEITKKAFQNAASAPYSNYALLARRRVGDQPGAEHWHYLTEWKSLPDGYIFPRALFESPAAQSYSVIYSPLSGSQDVSTNYVSQLPITTLPIPVTFSVPRLNEIRKLEFRMPYISFDAFGRVDSQCKPFISSSAQRDLARPFGTDLVISFTTGSVFLPRDAAGKPIRPAPGTTIDLVETPAPNADFNPYLPNRIHISSMSGRARVLKPRIQ